MDNLRILTAGRLPLLFLLLAVLSLTAIACGGDDDDASGGDPTPAATSGADEMPIPYPFEDATVTETGLEYVDIEVGDGDEAATGNRVSAHYTGTLLSGEVFDSSEGRDPFTFTIGMDNVIQGWHEGLVGMRVGGVRHLYIPAELAYGDRANGPIPANSPLLFKIQLLGIE